VVTFEPTVVISVQVPGLPALSGARSILNPVSLLELSTQDRLIWFVEIVIVVRPEGAGMGLTVRDTSRLWCRCCSCGW